ncbi:RNA recognition motif domain-containing protein [Mucilaginibacter sp.]|uniref:RNA recognition motif domain-containing protein n=1 Tax=Mucilaginibacter sp. TaxID=1882438 RepID=UPI003D0A97F6
MVKLFVGGFPLDFVELDIVMLVAPHGDVVTIKVVRDKKTKICKGYAFLEMESREAAERAIEALDGTKVKGRLLNVKIREEEPVAAVPVKAFEKKKRPRKQF